MTVVADLRTRREEQGLSQADVARLLGTTQSAVARLESGRIAPRLDTLDRYADAVGSALGLRARPPLVVTAAEGIREALSRDQPGTAFRVGVQLLHDLADVNDDSLDPELRHTPPDIGSRQWDAFLAGVVERAIRLRGGAVPAWTAAPSRSLTSWWFPVESITGNLSPGLACMILAAPVPELAVRGVMVDRTSLAPL